MIHSDFHGRIRPSAALDLEEIVVYLDARSENAGDRFLAEFFEAVKLLSKMPSLGAVRKNSGPLTPIRSWTLNKFDAYIVFYRP